MRLIAASVCFFFLIVQPLRANLIASLVHLSEASLDPKSQAALLTQASLLDPCNTDILNALGDAYLKAEIPIMGAMTYGHAMQCSPGHSWMRFKYGEALLMIGFAEGFFSIEDALRLEPNNELYQKEVARLRTALPQRSPSLPY